MRGTKARRGGGILEERQVQLPEEEHIEFGVQVWELWEMRTARQTAAGSHGSWKS